MFKRGDLVQTWFERSARDGGYVFGRVTKAGPVTFTVVWESANRNRVRQDTGSVKAITDPELQEVARKACRATEPVDTKLHNSPHRMATCASPDCNALTGRA